MEPRKIIEFHSQAIFTALLETWIKKEETKETNQITNLNHQLR